MGVKQELTGGQRRTTQLAGAGRTWCSGVTDSPSCMKAPGPRGPAGRPPDPPRLLSLSGLPRRPSSQHLVSLLC